MHPDPRQEEGPLRDIEEDARLDPGIQFPHPLSPWATAPRALLVTGATGFLGVYLLDELLHKTAATIYCLVRAGDDDEAGRRLSSQLRAYGLGQEQHAGRIRPLAGDLAQPSLGLGEPRFGELAAELDGIYHSAGWINMAFPYARLRPTNVLGTLELLRLAGAVRTKPLHFVSTIAVFYSDAHAHATLLSETTTPLYHLSLKGGYSKSKWVADRLVAAARERGLPACIYRPVRIMGHSRTGAMNDMSDLLPMLLKGCILLGVYPAWDIEVTFVPVDYASRALVHLSLQEASRGRDFHFFNPAPMDFRTLMGILCAHGYPLREVSPQEFRHELNRQRMQDATPVEHKELLSRLILGLVAPHFLFYKRPSFDDGLLKAGLSGTEIACPPISEELIYAYLEYWQKIHYLPLPEEL